jgi:hypothetical protein
MNKYNFGTYKNKDIHIGHFVINGLVDIMWITIFLSTG